MAGPAGAECRCRVYSRAMKGGSVRRDPHSDEWKNIRCRVAAASHRSGSNHGGQLTPAGPRGADGAATVHGERHVHAIEGGDPKLGISLTIVSQDFSCVRSAAFRAFRGSTYQSHPAQPPSAPASNTLRGLPLSDRMSSLSGPGLSETGAPLTVMTVIS